MNFGELMVKITPTWKMRKMYLWWLHNIRGNAFRRINEINRELFEKDSTTYKCNFCHNVVFKGSLKYGIILNCPSCSHQFSVFPEYPHKFKKLSLIQGSSSKIEKISKDSKLL